MSSARQMDSPPIFFLFNNPPISGDNSFTKTFEDPPWLENSLTTALNLAFDQGVKDIWKRSPAALGGLSLKGNHLTVFSE